MFQFKVGRTGLIVFVSITEQPDRTRGVTDFVSSTGVRVISCKEGPRLRWDEVRVCGVERADDSRNAALKLKSVREARECKIRIERALYEWASLSCPSRNLVRPLPGVAPSEPQHGGVQAELGALVQAVESAKANLEAYMRSHNLV